MTGNRAVGLILIAIGIAAMLWGLNLTANPPTPPAGAAGLPGNTGPLVIAAGAVLALIGLVFAVRSNTTLPPAMQSTPGPLQGIERPTPFNVPAFATADDLLAALKAQSPALAAKLNNPELLTTVVAHLRAGRKIEAIKALREFAYLDLKEGKDLAEEIHRTMNSPALASGAPSTNSVGDQAAAKLANPELLATVVGHLQADRRIEAIKTLRESTGLGLRETIDLVEQLERGMKNPTTGA
jgi:ribosomal protein L7/L12